MKKRKLLVSIIAFLLAFLMVFGIVASAIPTRVNAESSAEIMERIKELEAQKKEIDGKIDGLKTDIDENFSEMEVIVAQKNLIDQEVFLLNQQILNLNYMITEYGLLIADKQDELDDAQAHLAQLQEENKDRIRAMEKNGGLSYWSVIFKANSFIDLLDRLEMIEEIAEADKARLEEMNLAAQVVATAKANLETEKQALQASKDELNAAQVELEVKRAEADALLAQLVAIGQEYEDLLDEAEAEMYELAAEIAEEKDNYEDAKAAEWAAAHPPVQSNPSTPSYTPPSNESWMVPCYYTMLTSPFGYRVHPISGQYKMHSGVDLSGPTGTPIKASRSGTVTTATYGSSGGYYVYINHGDGFSSCYLHMTHYIVSPGQYVTKGQVIGYMGSTGASTGPHLHFGILYNGTYVNPASYIAI